MGADLVCIRQAASRDAGAIAAINEEAWRSAYQGVIPHLHLQRLIARSGSWSWRDRLTEGAQVLVLTFEEQVQGYASIGPARRSGQFRAGEIFELYMRPAFQGVGLGGRLFDAARETLERQQYEGLVVWALAENENACRFYRRRGGQPVAAAPERFGAVTLNRVAFAWPPRASPSRRP
jgi:ribosomal protein S18 acetylase RimI-like enzyme